MVPVLHEMLSDIAHVEQWPNIAQIIGMASSDVNSVSIITEYFRRSDKENFTRDRFGRKLYSIRYLGKIGGDHARAILTAAVTEEGAVELAKDWINTDLVKGDTTFGNRNIVIGMIQDAAIDGLVFLQEEHTNSLIDKLYKAERNKTKQKNYHSSVYGALVDGMAMKDFIADHGLEVFLLCADSISSDALSPYIERHSPELRKLKRKAWFKNLFRW